MTPLANPASEPYFADFVEGRRGEILDAALEVFSAKGYEAGTMREIAARVGVTEPALYRHYEGKEALLADLVCVAGDRVTGEARARLAEVDAADVRGSLQQLFVRRRQGFSDSRQIMRTLMAAAPHNRAIAGIFLAHFAKPMVANVRAFIPRIDSSFGIERSADDLEAKAMAFMSLFLGSFMVAKFFDSPSDDAIVDAMLAIMGWTSERDANPA